MQLPHYGARLDLARMDRTLCLAEASGFDSAWVTDHVAVPGRLAAEYGSITEALVTLGYLAGQSQRINLGVSALVVTARQPLLTLKQIASLDFLSGGRLILCVAAGWVEEEFQNLGYEFRTRGCRLDAWLDLFHSCIGQMPGPVSYDGPPPVHEAWLAPAPSAPAGPPIWVAGHSWAALARAARVGTWHPRAMPVAEFRPLAAVFKARCPHGTIISRMGVSFAPEAAAAGWDGRPPQRVAGPPAVVAEGLREYVRAGCDGFLITFVTDHGALEDHLVRFAEDVRPHLEG